MPNRDNAINYAKNNFNVFQNKLESFIRIPSVSTDTNHVKDIQSAAEFVKNQLIFLGVENVKILKTAGHPAVFGALLSSKPNVPTVLIYGHYDVQPADPIELWKTNPFEPTVNGDLLSGRGSSDMKGQILATLSAIESIKMSDELPVNLKFIFEGEEEIGSPNLPEVLEKYGEMLSCDVILNPDAGMISPDTPTIVNGLRGLAYFEIKITGPDHDLHSGLFGGIVPNPAIVLCDLISGMHDQNGAITLPGFYDKVVVFSEKERDILSRLPITDQDFLKQTGAKKLSGEKGYTSIERIGIRPTLDVNGFYSGFIGEGSKTIIPSWAMAKISMRLVPYQDPDEVYNQFIKYVEQNIPPSVSWETKKHAGGFASTANLDHPGVIALSNALETVWGKKPVYKREGGSIPIVAEMQRTIGTESVLTGFGLPDDNIHSPNERLHLPTWRKGILAIIHFLYNFGGINEN
jgi:acetylornithine deacetylase/succinyl-diaminopimelate desuccinylase-like protein